MENTLKLIIHFSKYNLEHQVTFYDSFRAHRLAYNLECLGYTVQIEKVAA